MWDESFLEAGIDDPKLIEYRQKPEKQRPKLLHRI